MVGKCRVQKDWPPPDASATRPHLEKCDGAQTVAATGKIMKQEDWEKLIDEILEQGMDLVWNEKTEKYEKKDEVCA